MQKGTKLNSLFGTKDKKGEAQAAAGAAADADKKEDETKVAPVEGEGASDKVIDPEVDPTDEGKAVSGDKEGEGKPADPYADWTKEDIIKEMKSARDEAAKNRVEKKALEENLTSEYDRRLKEIEAKFAPIADKAKELDSLKDKEADRKRTLEEKLSHRETAIEELQGKLTEIEDKYREEKVQLQSEKEKAQAELTAYETYWKDQLDKELKDIPEKFSKTAELIVKGAGKTREALEEIRTAKKEGMFSTKSVKVFNATPGAKDGARIDSEKEKEAKKKGLSSMKKIGEGLKQWRNAKRS